MQAVQVSRAFREQFDRALDRGAAAFTLYKQDQSVANMGALADALAGYSEAFTIADLGASVAPSRDYAKWLDLRSRAHRARNHVRTLIGEWSTVAAEGLR